MADTSPPATVHHLTHRMRESAKRIKQHREALAIVAQEACDQRDTENGKEVNQS